VENDAAAQAFLPILLSESALGTIDHGAAAKYLDLLYPL
jgi:hypothetical protein